MLDTLDLQQLKTCINPKLGIRQSVETGELTSTHIIDETTAMHIDAIKQAHNAYLATAFKHTSAIQRDMHTAGGYTITDADTKASRVRDLYNNFKTMIATQAGWNPSFDIECSDEVALTAKVCLDTEPVVAWEHDDEADRHGEAAGYTFYTVYGDPESNPGMTAQEAFDGFMEAVVGANEVSVTDLYLLDVFATFNRIAA